MLIGLLIASLSADAQQKLQVPPSFVSELQDELRQRDEAIRDLSQRVAALEKQVKALRVNEASAGTLGPAATVASPNLSPPPIAAHVRRSASSQEYDKEELLARTALDRALISRGGLLLPPGMVEIDNGISYFDASSDQLYVNGFTVYPVLIVGDIVSERTQRDILLSSITTRLGLPHDFQLDVRVPYGYQSERTVTADNKKTSQRFLGLGDVEVGLTKQLKRGRGLGPDLLAGFRWKSTTGPDPYQPTSTEAALGTGFQSLEGSLTAVKPSDPLVYFGSVSYTANLSATKQIQSSDPTNPNSLTTGYVNPGDTIGFQVGAALSVNPVASLNFALDQRFTRSTSLDGKSLPGTYLSEAVLQLGTAYVYAPGRSIELGLGIGLSRGAPDFQLSVNFPLRFSLAKRAR
jgi:hypothetical protein